MVPRNSVVYWFAVQISKHVDMRGKNVSMSLVPTKPLPHRNQKQQCSAQSVCSVHQSAHNYWVGFLFFVFPEARGQLPVRGIRRW